jgi:hypothetical protein
VASCLDSSDPASLAAPDVVVVAAHAPEGQAGPQADVIAGDPLPETEEPGAAPAPSLVAQRDVRCASVAPDGSAVDDSYPAYQRWVDSARASVHSLEADLDPGDCSVARRADDRWMPAADWAGLIPDDCSERARAQRDWAVPMDDRSGPEQYSALGGCSGQVDSVPADSAAQKAHDHSALAEHSAPDEHSVRADSVAADSAVLTADDHSAPAGHSAPDDYSVQVDSAAGGCSVDWIRGVHSAQPVGLAAQLPGDY